MNRIVQELKVAALQELLQEVLEWLYYSDADYSNGVVVQGFDEGRCLANKAICEMLDKGETLGVMVRHHEEIPF